MISLKQTHGLMSKKMAFPAFLAFLSALLLSGCATPQEYIGRKNWIAVMSESALTSGKISYRTRMFMVEHALIEKFESDPAESIKELAKMVESDNGANIRPALNALVELCFFRAAESNGDIAIKYWLSCSFYSFRILFDKSLNSDDDEFDHLDKTAALRYYNISTSEIFSYMNERKIPFSTDSELAAVSGVVRFSSMKSNLLWNPDSFEEFIVTYDYIPNYLNSHAFRSGLGVPLIATKSKNYNFKTANKEMNIVEHAYPVNFIVSYDSFHFSDKPLPASFEFHDDFKTEDVEIHGRTVPLSKDFSIMLTSIVSRKYIQDGLWGMINSDAMGDAEGLYMLSPFDKNKIPVVLVHGLMSSPRTWLQIVNTLLCSKKIREHYQFWLFRYPTGQPVYYSASKLRNSLNAIEKKYDPEGENPYFNRMVVFGHSMGGLLTRLMLLDSDQDKLADTILALNSLDKRFSELKLSPDEREFFTDILVFNSLPFIKRVVFLATPHKGSETATWNISKFGSSIINLPVNMVTKTQQAFNKISMFTKSDKNKLKIATSIDNLDPKSTFVSSYNGLKYGSKVKMHSIIGDQYNPRSTTGSDGVVPYWSSHLEGVESELILKSGHNVQENSECSRELRRILLEHLHSTD